MAPADEFSRSSSDFAGKQIAKSTAMHSAVSSPFVRITLLRCRDRFAAEFALLCLHSEFRASPRFGTSLFLSRKHGDGVLPIVWLTAKVSEMRFRL
jgi:hypothetical protein